MADDIFVSNDIELDVDFGEIFVVDQGVVTKVIANKYEPTQTYVVGDYVIYADKLYRCTTAIETPEAFDNTKWTNVKLANEVQTINEALPLKADKSDTYTKQEVDTALSVKANADDVTAALNLKADKSDTYTKEEVNTALADKADKSDTYTKTEVDTALSAKANTTDVDTALTFKADKADTYTKTAVDNALALKADQATTYTKTEVDSALSTKANSADVYNKTEVYTKDQVDGIINNMPAPMIFKGTLGTGGTITTLPTASSDNEGYTYKVITDGTYASQSAKAGDMFTSNGSAWIYIPSGDETFTDTWRGIKVNGTEQLTSSIASGDVDFVNGTNSTVVFDATGNKIKVNVDGYTQSEVDTKLALKADASTTYSKTEVDTALSSKANTSDVNTALDGKADKSTTYTKTEVDTALGNKADKSTTYTKTEVDTALSGKANASTTYTKSEVDSALSSKANSADVYTKTQTDTALANKANTSGEYNGLISGQANALKPSARLENSTPYLFRPSYSNGYGYETLVGGTCGVNQLVATSNINQTATYCNVLITNNNDGTVTLSGTADADGWAYISGAFTVIDNHVYLLGGSDSLALSDGYITDGRTRIVKNTYGNSMLLYARLRNGVTYNTTIGVICVDLTAYFDTTIADYAYTLESGTAGAGITWLKNNGFFTADYYPYNAGGLLSVKTSKKITTGLNQFDESNLLTASGWALSDGYYTGSVGQLYTVFGVNSAFWYNDINTDSQMCITYTAYVSDANANARAVFNYTDGTSSFAGVINSTTESTYTVVSTSGKVVKSITFDFSNDATLYIKGFCINISCDLDGQYEPYVSHEYPLDGSRKVHRVFGIVDLGTIYYVKGNRNTDNTGYIFYALASAYFDNFKIYGDTISDTFVFDDVSMWEDLKLWEYKVTDYLIFCADFPDAGAFKTAMSGKYLVFELATPFDETVSNPELRGILKLDSDNNLYYYGDTCSDFTNPMLVDGNGTEQFVDGRTVEMPVGHSTIYVDDNDATKLENLPDISDSGDGTYVVKQENGEMTLDKYGAFSTTELTAVASLQWSTRANYYEKEGSCYIDILGGTPTNGFAENAVVFSGAPIPQSGYAANLIGLCNGAFYRFYVDATTGEVKCRNAISAGNTEFSVFGSYFVQ